MTLAQAQKAAADLRTALLDHGVRAVSIELQQGVAGSGWGVAPFKRVLGHHVASYPPGTPGLGTVKKGRGQPNPLTGPLANCYGGFDLTARIITLGWANHPGTGGPWSVPGWGTVPKDNGRPYILGWEFEGGFLDYTAEMHDFMARCGAASLDWLGTLPGNPGPAPLQCFDEHKGWAGPRKPDRRGYTTASGRARIATVRDDRRTTGAVHTPSPAQPPLEDLVAQMTPAQLDQYLADIHTTAVNSQVIADAVTVGREGIKHDGDLITALRRVEAPAITTADALTLGKEGVKYDGDVVSLLKDVAAGVVADSPTS